MVKASGRSRRRSPEEGGALRTASRGPLLRALLIVAVVAVFAAGLAALQPSRRATPSRRPSAAAPAGRTQLLSARVAETTTTVRPSGTNIADPTNPTTTTSTVPELLASHLLAGAVQVAADQRAAEHRAAREALARAERRAAYETRLRAAHRAAALRAAEHRAAERRAAAHRAAARRHHRTGTHTGTSVRRHRAGDLVGVATWYAWRPGQCATSYRPKGTRIWIEDLATHRTVSCLVTDYEPRSPGRVVDLDSGVFAELAPLAQGVIRVRVTW